MNKLILSVSFFASKRKVFEGADSKKKISSLKTKKSFFFEEQANKTNSRPNVLKTSGGPNYFCTVVSWNVCHHQSLLPWSNIFCRGQSLPGWNFLAGG